MESTFFAVGGSLFIFPFVEAEEKNFAFVSSQFYFWVLMCSQSLAAHMARTRIFLLKTCFHFVIPRFIKTYALLFALC